jgi:Putative adhesin
MRNPTMKWHLAALGCILAAAFPMPAADEGGRQWLHDTKTERVDFAPGGTIRVDGSDGDLNIEAWDRPEVEVTINKSTQRLYTAKEADDARKRLDLVALKLDRKSPTEVTISTTFPSRTLKRLFRGKFDYLLEYRIHVPRNSHLIVRHGTGTVVMTGVTGDVEASTHVGDIVLMIPGSDGYSVDARTKFGGIHSDFGGAAGRHHVTSGQLSFAPASPQHRIVLRVGIGDINIQAQYGAALKE